MSLLIRNIPAHAGKTSPCSTQLPRRREHPRARGENSMPMDLALAVAGTSPRTRGKHTIAAIAEKQGGNIPAHAGKTQSADSTQTPSEEHPRARGENTPPTPQSPRPTGTSPRTRGKRGCHQGAAPGMRNIPAHAGKTTRIQRCYQTKQEHPRARGENLNTQVTVLDARGTSPRTRGKHVRAMR